MPCLVSWMPLAVVGCQPLHLETAELSSMQARCRRGFRGPQEALPLLSTLGVGCTVRQVTELQLLCCSPPPPSFLF